MRQADIDHYDIERLRWCVHDFLVQRVIPSVSFGDSVLEIGPSHEGTSPVPEAFVNTKWLVQQCGATYTSIDRDPAAQATICGVFLAAGVFHEHEYFHHIIACEVFEHVPDVWRAPAVLRSLLLPGGTLWFSTPFMFRQHGPKPDCWRLTEDGIRHLFGERFSLTILPSDNGPAPLHHCVIARAL